ncbi:AraC family transcriptional regulator [Mucilaginibacter sp. OK098]|uniref:AraC family transcriptional regulator n=1 Tax=Mucilaginibacter sp. OK098 TaxID=1855297 RepID=UPI00091052CC|nr:AraC family transcriptional regulator [Mucilaginibacter sp. OK098]SHM76641.1 AraC-type DNA-binding protein [Mucilaginibacter sp. OK098]
MQLHFYRPRHPLLSDLIEGYYFLSGTAPEAKLSYYTFPNNFLIVSVLENAQIFVQGNRVTCTPAAYQCFQANLTYNYTEPLLIQYTGQLNELTIYFKPLGLHAFFPAVTWCNQTANFTDFDPFADFQEVMMRILHLNDRERQITLLEGYWISKKLREPEPLLLRIAHEMEGGKAVAEIANSLHLSRQYFSRLFLKNFGKTPATYRKIHRFRNVVRAKTGYGNLTALGLGNFFYDQSHFIKNFKELTALTPKLFFDKVDARKDNLWLYV